MPGVEGEVEGWRKAIAVGGEGGGDDGTRPPLAPTRFAAQLKEKKFTNNADLKVVCNLYEHTLRDGFGACEQLAYGACGWGDAEAEELGVTLSEVAAPEVVELDLSSDWMRSLSAVGAAVGAGALASLQARPTASYPRCITRGVCDVRPILGRFRACRPVHI